jgi:hypothetical protein
MIRSVLPLSQQALWDGPLATLPSGWVLYGGTAIALHLGHRQSVDFDFFSTERLDRGVLRRSCPFLVGAKTLQDEPDTLTVVVENAGDSVKLSFFGGLDETLSDDVKNVLRGAALAFRPETTAAAKRSSRLD